MPWPPPARGPTPRPYLEAALPVPRVADVGRVGDHVGAVDVVDGLALGEGSQVSVVQDLVAQPRLREGKGGGTVRPE